VNQLFVYVNPLFFWVFFPFRSSQVYSFFLMKHLLQQLAGGKKAEGITFKVLIVWKYPYSRLRPDRCFVLKSFSLAAYLPCNPSLLWRSSTNSNLGGFVYDISVSIVATVSIFVCVCVCVCVCLCVCVVLKFHSEKSVLHAFSPPYIVLGIK